MSRFLEMMPLTKFVAVLYAANSPYNTSAQDQLIYLHADHLGVVRRASDSDFSLSFSQRQVWSWESDAFGISAPLQDPDGNGVQTVINLRFPGQYYDAESGLYYNGNRYYDPKMGRYISSDPIGLSGGMNTYAYVGNNPVNELDIFGLTPTGAARGRLVGTGIGTLLGGSAGALGFGGLGTFLGPAGTVAGGAYGAVEGGVLGGATGYAVGGVVGDVVSDFSGAVDGWSGPWPPR